MQDFELGSNALPAAARRVVAGVCRRARTGAECRDAAVLLTSEVVTNALLHGRGGVRLAVGVDHVLVRVEVGDDEPGWPLSPSMSTTDAEGGRGMSIVEALASDWGVVQDVPGKTVWFEVPAQP